ncbi:MAG: hypothetical protein R2849_19045 [Thermomicrobiales bacterium]
MTGIAVHAESGNVFVADGALDRIQMFSLTGNHLLTWGSEGSGEEQIDDPRVAGDRRQGLSLYRRLRQRSGSSLHDRWRVCPLVR